MTISFLFWLVYIICLIFFGIGGWDRTNSWRSGGNVALFVMLGLLGYAVFGSPIK